MLDCNRISRWGLALVNSSDTVEGRDDANIEDPGAYGWADYPLDAVFVRTETRTVAEAYKRIRGERYVLDPDFQRDFVWDERKQSKLIESCLMRIPLPVFYVAEAEDGRIIVVDGLQRLTTFTRFLDCELRLTGLKDPTKAEHSHPLEGKYFSELPINLQERVQDTQLTMYILDAKAPERARLDIFERVNSGASLTRQQMRNALYNGPATRWLRDAAASAEFQATTAGGLDDRTMRDREAINRFCAFQLMGWESYTTGDMDDFLAKGLKTLGSLDDDQRQELRRLFDTAIRLNHVLFGDHAFRKSLVGLPEQNRSVINISLFEVCCVAMCKLGYVLEEKPRHEALRNVVIGLIADKEFNAAITYSTNSTRSVKARFSKMGGAISAAGFL